MERLTRTEALFAHARRLGRFHERHVERREGLCLGGRRLECRRLHGLERLERKGRVGCNSRIHLLCRECRRVHTNGRLGHECLEHLLRLTGRYLGRHLGGRA